MRCGFHHFSTTRAERGLLWHRSCFKKSCQSFDFIEKFLNILPKKIDPSDKQSPKDFTRERKLPFSKLVTFILSITTSGKSQGVESKSGAFFKNARRSKLWPDAEAIHRSTLTKARKKVHWRIFEDILAKAVDVAYELWPDRPEYLWHDMSVYAVDGSKYTLPATPELREEFDRDSGLDHSGKGHYPQCLVSTVYDVFRRLPIARTVVSIHGSERQEAKSLLPCIPPDSVALFDRGYPGYEFIKELVEHFSGYFVCRCPAESTFPAVESFVKSEKEEAVIWINPSNKYRRRMSLKQRKKLKPIKLRVVKLRSPDGTISVLLTNLFGQQRFARSEIIALYFRRWEVENYYRDEKVVLEVDKFHGKTSNSIRQELFAAMIMSVISRTLMALSACETGSGLGEPQFKNAIMTLASDAAVLVPDEPEKAIEIFNEIIEEISRVKYYRPKEPRQTQPRVTKRKINKWSIARQRKLANA